MTDIVTAVSTVGFPIVMCIIIVYLMRENAHEHQEEVTKLTETLNNNTVVLGQLKELLEFTLKKEDLEKDGD